MRIRRALQVRLAQHNVPLGHWTFLRILWEHDGLTQSELSKKIDLSEHDKIIKKSSPRVCSLVVTCARRTQR